MKLKTSNLGEQDHWHDDMESGPAIREIEEWTGHAQARRELRRDALIFTLFMLVILGLLFAALKT